jgi:hypothetical protein
MYDVIYQPLRMCMIMCVLFNICLLYYEQNCMGQWTIIQIVRTLNSKYDEITAHKRFLSTYRRHSPKLHASVISAQIRGEFGIQWMNVIVSGTSVAHEISSRHILNSLWGQDNITGLDSTSHCHSAVYTTYSGLSRCEPSALRYHITLLLELQVFLLRIYEVCI